MKIKVLSLALLTIFAADIFGQGCPCDINVDVDGDSVSDGILYKDIIYELNEIDAYNDFLGSLPSITYATDVELYDGSLTDLKMDVYFPPASGDSCIDNKKPVVFYFYGGGFVEGTSARVKDLCREMAQRGYITVAPNYRLGFYGAYEEDSADLCDDLLEPARASYRGLLDAQAAMNYMKDNYQSLGLDIDTTKMFVHGPSFFGMMGLIQTEDLPGTLLSIGPWDDNLQIAGGVSRSGSLYNINKWIDPTDDTPIFMFHGTCDKSVPFKKTSAYRRFECDLAGVPPVNDYTLFGSLLISNELSFYHEFYPICGLNHSLKDIEDREMKQPIADFFYKISCGLVSPTDEPLFTPLILEGCDVSKKCTVKDYYDFCDTAFSLPPFDPSCRLAESEEDYMDIPDVVEVYPNPSNGSFMVSVQSTEEKPGRLELFDLTGRMVEGMNIQLFRGNNTIQMDVSLARGIYLLKVGEYTKRIILE